MHQYILLKLTCLIVKYFLNNCFIYLQPLHYISWFGNWIVAQVMWFFVEFNLQWIGNLAFSYPIDDG